MRRRPCDVQPSTGLMPSCSAATAIRGATCRLRALSQPSERNGRACPRVSVLASKSGACLPWFGQSSRIAFAVDPALRFVVFLLPVVTVVSTSPRASGQSMRLMVAIPIPRFPQRYGRPSERPCATWSDKQSPDGHLSSRRRSNALRGGRSREFDAPDRGAGTPTPHSFGKRARSFIARTAGATPASLGCCRRSH